MQRTQEGSTHDSFIWRRSHVSNLLEQMHSGGMCSYYLLKKF